MGKDTKFVAWFNELGKQLIALAGGEEANSTEMTRAGIPVAEYKSGGKS